MLKKMMLLAMAVAAVAAFAVPAAASADVWTDNGTVLEPEEDITQAYEGVLTFNTGATGTFGCNVTIVVTTNGPEAAQITKFSPTTTSCVGTVAFKGCELIEDLSNTPWDVHNATTPLVVTKAGANMTIFNKYKAGSCAGGQTSSHLEFKQVEIDVEGGNPTITGLKLTGAATNGVPVSGTVTPESPTTLGIK
jgi:hypothetical protein